MAALERELGTMDEARAAAGLSRRPPRLRNPEAVVEGLRVQSRLGTRMTPKGLVEAGEARLVSAVYRHFPSFERARAAAGIETPPPPPRKERTTLAEATKAVRAAKRALGRTPLQLELERRFVSRLLKEHGSWIAVIAALGMDLPPLPNQKWTKASVIEALRRLHDGGAHITNNALIDAGRADVVLAATRHHGSLVKARKLAGIPPPPARP